LVKPDATFTRTELARHLDERRIGNRMLFGGNLVRQPALVQLKKDNPASMRVIGDMSGADSIMNDALFVGTYPGLSTSMLEYMVSEIAAFSTSRVRA
jgi:CDP-4-dehydro-6-deoxyglucose reductase, E1